MQIWRIEKFKVKVTFSLSSLKRPPPAFFLFKKLPFLFQVLLFRHLRLLKGRSTRFACSLSFVEKLQILCWR